MSQVVSCPSCGAQYNAAGYEPGVQFECTNCAALVTVPDEDGYIGADAETMVAEFEEEEEVAAPAGARKAGARGGKGKAARGGGKGKAGAPGRKGAASAPPPAPARGGKGKAAAGGGGRGATKSRGAAGGGRGAAGGGRGGRSREEQMMMAAERAEKQKMTMIIVSIIGGVVIILGLLMVMNSGGAPPEPEGDPVAEDGTNNGSGAPVEKGPDPLDAIRNDEAVKAAATRFIEALQKGDQSMLVRVFDTEGWLKVQQESKKTVAAIEQMGGTDVFMKKCWSAQGDWHEYFAHVEVTATPDQFKGADVWYYERGDVGIAKYSAKYNFVLLEKNREGVEAEKAPWEIQLELKLDAASRSWKVKTYNDKEYKGKAPSRQIFFERKMFEIPVWEWAANVEAYRAQTRMPPAPWDTPIYVPKDDPAATNNGNNGGDTTDPNNPNNPTSGDHPISVPSAGDPSGWGADVVKEFDKKLYDKAEEICGRNRVTEELSAWLIGVLVEGFNAQDDRDKCLRAAQASRLLSRLYGKNGSEYSFEPSPMHANGKPENRKRAVINWIDEHDSMFGG